MNFLVQQNYQVNLTACVTIKQGGLRPGMVQLVPSNEESVGSVMVITTPRPGELMPAQENSTIICSVLLSMYRDFIATFEGSRPEYDRALIEDNVQGLG